MDDRINQILRGFCRGSLSKFSPEVRKRAVQMVLDHQAEYPTLRAAMNRLQAEQAV